MYIMSEIVRNKIRCWVEKTDDEILRYTREVAKREHIPKSVAIRKLLALGIEYNRKLKAIQSYKEGKISLGKAAETAGVCTSEMMDILIRFGVKANVTFEDYKRGMKETREVMESQYS